MSDRVLLVLLRAAAAVSGGLVLLVALFVVLEAAPLLARLGPERFVVDGWHPSEGSYGLTPMIAGTLLVAAGALVLAAPLGLASALFRHFYAPVGVGRIHRRVVELLAGVPSVVYGFWGLVVLVPLVAGIEPPGASLLAGILVLTLMILPTVALTADAALEAVPREQLVGAAALGLTRWTVARRIALPSARSGILTGVVLAGGRAVGETMAVLMVCGNVVQVPDSLFDPVRTLTANIALEMAYAVGDHRSALYVSGLVLLAVVAALVAGAEWIGREGSEAARG